MSPSDPTVMIALDTNVQMMREIPFDVVVADRCWHPLCWQTCSEDPTLNRTLTLT